MNSNQKKVKKALEQFWHLKRNIEEEVLYIKDKAGNKYQLNMTNLSKHVPLRKGYVWDLRRGIKVIKEVNNEEIAWYGWTRVEHWHDGIRFEYFQKLVDNLELHNYFDI